FNEMAKKISQKNKELEIKIEEAVEKNLQKNRLMLQQNRLAAMGEMISNIAHQWRQPLNTLGLILQKLEILHKRGTLDEEKLKENITNGMSQINKMSTTIDDFRDFFKKDKKKRIFYLKEAIEESLLFMKTPLEENSIQVTYDRELSVQVNGYKNELTQVIVNIINNAKDALVENKNIDRRIDILCTVKDEHIVIKIEDNAGGIPKDVIDKIFEPYFTTKVEGEGDGIGLYMSKIIIEENMNGKLDVHNSEDGAVLTITLFSDIIDPFCEISYSAEE
ncbi:MAG: ATP-binding protein, partial [Campylobacterota bacterium]